jgi:hypothetical protein
VIIHKTLYVSFLNLLELNAKNSSHCAKNVSSLEQSPLNLLGSLSLTSPRVRSIISYSGTGISALSFPLLLADMINSSNEPVLYVLGAQSVTAHVPIYVIEASFRL